jgi:predicted type IV restriction endonuclease
MNKLPKKFVERVARSLKNYQTVTENQRKKDVSEADTVTVVKDILADIFGYDKYIELTSEHQIRGTYCDLAIRIENKLRFLIEVKAAGLELDDHHLRQTINYAANQGIEWIALTNGSEWQLHKVLFGKPIDREEVTKFNLHTISAQREGDLQILFLLAREGMATDAISSFHQRAQLLNKFTVAQMILSENVIHIIRRDFRRLFPDLKIQPEQIQDILWNEVLKREVLEGDKVREAQKRIKRAARKLQREAERESETIEKPLALERADQAA